MLFQSKGAVRSNIIINYQTVDQVSYINYSEYDIGCSVRYDIDIKLDTFPRLCKEIILILRNIILKDRKLKFYEFIAVSVLFYGSQFWVITRKTIN